MNSLLTNKKDIIAWLDDHKVKRYSLVQHAEYGYAVDVEGHVNLAYQLLDALCVKFNQIDGEFNCGYNNLTSLY